MTNIVDVLISRLRNKVDRNFDAKLILRIEESGMRSGSRNRIEKKPRASSDGMVCGEFLVITVALSIHFVCLSFLCGARQSKKLFSLGSNNSPRLRTIRASTPSVRSGNIKYSKSVRKAVVIRVVDAHGDVRFQSNPEIWTEFQSAIEPDPPLGLGSMCHHPRTEMCSS